VTARPEPLREVVQRAETLGYESVWIPEHLAVPVKTTTPYPYSAGAEFPGGAMVPLHDPFIAPSFIASCTERIKLGTAPKASCKSCAY
jgi:alkanesulfonate monooxygenase SsuD/methylene tetrahydromethanopterin reductase-like flavin-dependent oxidoreductase (luciferase family)